MVPTLQWTHHSGNQEYPLTLPNVSWGPHRPWLRTTISFQLCGFFFFLLSFCLSANVFWYLSFFSMWGFFRCGVRPSREMTTVGDPGFPGQALLGESVMRKRVILLRREARSFLHYLFLCCCFFNLSSCLWCILVALVHGRECFFFFFGSWDLGSSTRDWTQGPWAWGALVVEFCHQRPRFESQCCP